MDYKNIEKVKELSTKVTAYEQLIQLLNNNKVIVSISTGKFRILDIDIHNELDHPGHELGTELVNGLISHYKKQLEIIHNQLKPL